MTQFTTLPLENHSATEDDFTPGTVNHQTGVITWYGPPRMNSLQENKDVVTLSLVTPSAKSSRARVRLKVSRPVLDSMTSKRLDEDIFTCEFSLSRLSDLSNRQDLIAYAVSLLNSDPASNAVLNYEGTY
jgi:hypothetical protein